MIGTMIGSIGPIDFCPAKRYNLLIRAAGEIAVPCTCNPLQQG